MNTVSFMVTNAGLKTFLFMVFVFENFLDLIISGSGTAIARAL